AEPAAVAREPLGGDVEGLVPADLDPAPVATDQRRRDPVARVDEAGPEASLDAEHAEARAVRRHVVGHHREFFREKGAPPPSRLPREHANRDAAANATVRARRLDGARDLGWRFFRPQRAGRARRHALAARGAHGRSYGAVAEDADLRRVAAPEQRDRPDLLDVVARDRAAAAEDARLAVEDE